VKQCQMMGRNLLMGKSGGRLPAEYQEVEYISSETATAAGQMYIDTGTSFDGTQKYYLKFEIMGFPYNGQTFGGNNGYGTNTIALRTDNGYVCAWNKRELGVTVPGNVANEYILSKDELYINGVLTVSRTIEDYAVNNISLFAMSYGGNHAYSHSAIRLYYFYAEDANGNKYMDYVPCYRKSDGAVGMFDLCTASFKQNSGTVEFLKGADVN